MIRIQQYILNGMGMIIVGTSIKYLYDVNNTKTKINSTIITNQSKNIK